MNKITWDKYSLIINDKRKFLLSGEFHYWRVPDVNRWEDILKMYKILGLNSVRIYFHWGYHNPTEGKYYFDGNRDVDYLLQICEQLDLYVFIAAGPYICAETNGGGFPGWLLAKRDINIKHLKRHFKNKFDQKYMDYCRDWYKHFIPIISKYQLVNDQDGKIIGFQIDNEYFEKLLIYRASPRYIKELIECAKKLGIKVPTFHNDAWELNSWNGLVDLYGFDKYIIQAPKFPKKLPLTHWKMKRFSKKVDKMEKKIRSFGDAAADSPIFIPELQGGWYNQYGVKYGYDELYDFYGSNYQKMLESSIAAQGCTMMSLYMLYGGTSWGAVPDSSVYTSYDYSGAIREYGYQSDRFRYLRLFNLFVKSFEENITCTDLVRKTQIKINNKNVHIRQRQSPDGTNFYFIRNEVENPHSSCLFTLTLLDNIRVPKVGSHQIRFHGSLIAIGNHYLGDFFIKFCSLPIIIKSTYLDGYLLVVNNNGGELLLNGNNYTTKGDIKVINEENFTRFIFQNEGYSQITNLSGNKLFIICLSEKEALTLNANFKDNNIQLAWGVYSIFFNRFDQLEIETIGKQTLKLLNFSSKNKNLENINGIFNPNLRIGEFGEKCIPKSPKLKNWSRIKTDWSNNMDRKVWKEINFPDERDPIDHHFTSGHVLYKCIFDINKLEKLKFKLNIRHKAAIWLNGHFIGESIVYKAKILRPGAFQGPEFPSIGSKKFNLTHKLNQGKNVLYILTENLGHNRQVYIYNDIRNPRGILSAKFSKSLNYEKWYISGIDTTTLDQSFNTSGLPGENFLYHQGKGNEWKLIDGSPTLTPDDQIVWYKTSFTWDQEENTRCPLRLHLEGRHNIHIFLNSIYIGKYWGSYGPQHDFYLMDALLQKENILVLACWTSEFDDLNISIKPYKIKVDSGNLDEEGFIFLTNKYIIE
jgi:hypothetical protein